MNTQRFKITVAVNLVLRKDGKILLLKRVNTGHQDGMYSLVAGHIEGNELMTVAVAREAKEEIGIIIKPRDLTFVHLTHRLAENSTQEEYVDMFFEASKWQGEVVNSEPNKCSELMWCMPNDLPPLMQPFIQVVLENISNSSYYSEYTKDPMKER